MDRLQIDSHSSPLVITAGFYHPDASIRARLRVRLDEWLEKLGPRADSNELRDIIQTQKGTAIEPFELEEVDIDCAVFLAQAAFSKVINMKRFRIVSRETIGSEGGLVITSNLKSYYSERFAHGKNRNKQRAGVQFVPSLIPATQRKKNLLKQRGESLLSAEDEGFRIDIQLSETSSPSYLLARDYQRHSRIIGVKDSFDQLGLRVEFSSGRLQVLSGSPESMIRLMAHMVEQRTLQLNGESDVHDEIPSILVALDVPGEKAVKLKTLVSCTSSYLEWMHCGFSSSITIDVTEMLAISDFLRPHMEWMHDIWKELP